MSSTIFTPVPATSPQSTPSKKVRPVAGVTRRVEHVSYYRRVALIILGHRCHEGTRAEDTYKGREEV